MTDQIVRLGPEYFPDPTSGRPISGGSVFIGKPDIDPELIDIPANQVQVSALQEDGTTVPISQPIETSGGGLPLYNGSNVTLIVSESYSMRVMDSFGQQRYYIPSTDVPIGTSSDVSSVKDLIGLINISSPVDDQTHVMLSFFDSLDKGGGIFYWDSSIDKSTADGGTIIDPDNIGGFDGTTGTLSAFLSAQGAGVGFGCWIRVFDDATFTTWFGALGNGTDDDTASILASIASLPDGGHLEFPVGTYLYTASLDITKRIFLSGTLGTEDHTQPIGTVILKSGNFIGVVLHGFSSRMEGIIVEGDTGNGGDGIQITGNSISLKNVASVSHGGNGLRVGTDDTDNTNHWNLFAITARNNTGHGIYIHDPNGSVDANGGFAYGLTCSFNGGDGLRIDRAEVNSFFGMSNEQNTGNGVSVGPLAKNNIFYGVHAEANGLDDFVFDSGSFNNTYHGSGNVTPIDNGSNALVLFGIGTKTTVLSDSLRLADTAFSRTPVHDRGLGIEGVLPGMYFYETGGPVDEKMWEIFSTAGTFRFATNTDTGAARNDFLTIARTGTTIDIIRFLQGQVTFTGGIGVGNSLAASTLGTVVKKMQIFDETGASIGFIPIYDAIT